MVPAMRMFEKQSSELYTSNLVHEELKDRWPSDAAHEMQCTSWACLEHAEQAAQTETAIGDGAKKDRALKKKRQGQRGCGVGLSMRMLANLVVAPEMLRMLDSAGGWQDIFFPTLSAKSREAGACGFSGCPDVGVSWTQGQ